MTKQQLSKAHAFFKTHLRTYKIIHSEKVIYDSGNIGVVHTYATVLASPQEEFDATVKAATQNLIRYHEDKGLTDEDCARICLESTTKRYLAVINQRA